ncbi:putative quinol monooxygenase [Urbifossiella limnaea]|uniref:Putative quinol monooxygenase YgiN n=1 Tax=Urbifossiella limnaea TaxID=2528023 RepID=A0A517XRG8_9BACT|nr:putative quinol monooxygenase [Urbifossiella limnaea]QDU20110.1 putative quinol monooxygenase YgiN [Urbifossiella limnaea]
MIHVIATIRLNPGTRAAFLDVFHKLVPLVLAEDGCLAYGPTVDEPTGLAVQELAGEDAVVVVEQWASPDALRAHSAAPHMADYRVAVKDYVRGVSLLVLRPA